MRKGQDDEKSSTAPSLLEWQICDSDVEWQSSAQDTLTTPPLFLEGTLRRSWVAQHWRIGTALLLILSVIGGWIWSISQKGIAQIETELRDIVELDLWTTPSQDAQPIHRFSNSAQGEPLRPFTSTIQLLALPGETAIIQLIIQPELDQPRLRQSRFYRKTAEGWLHTKPNADLWGTPRHLELSHFIFHFRQNDAQVVHEVAPQIDEIYTTVQRNFDLTPDAEKLVIEVSVEHITGAMVTPPWSREPLVVPSPAVYLAPVELDDRAILAQSIVFPIIEYMGERTIEDHAIPMRWQPLLRGLRLWQLWDLDMPLARWRHDLVEWLYVNAPTVIIEQRSSLPDSYIELCAMHRLWMTSPEQVDIPLACTARDAQNWSPSRWLRYVPRTHLDQLSVPLAEWESEYDAEDSNPYYSSEAVVVANLIEYSVAVYGYERLPVLLASLPHHASWETLLPAVFGVSTTEFEAGWRSYLAKQYNITLSQ